MKRLVKVGHWGNRAGAFLLDLEQRNYRKLDDLGGKEYQSAGTVKFFIGGRPVFLFNDEDAWYIWIPGAKEPIPLEDLKLSSKQKFGVLRELTLVHDSKRKSFLQLHMSGVWEKLDPTFDELDRSTEDFIHHLMVKQKEALKKKQSDFS